MRVLLLFAFLASFASAAVDTLYGNYAINSVIWGGNMTLAGAHSEQVRFAGATTDSYWFIEEIAEDVKPWHILWKGSHVTGKTQYLSFNEYKRGELATTNQECGSIFEIEYASDGFFVFSPVERSDRNEKLFWTLKYNESETDPDIYLSLDTERESATQAFTLIYRPVIP
ncbi:hypothetical protein McanMca71_003139 [Microsporum canis]|uniref:Lipocalin-like domain-containing protein n=1 Tax=Arthroderma otae (strain ATCC MYA-4605 / CBS 113480) TaxID=554155 RepID=C5FZZ3_ARTOC|nr:uncharacterized protein MCYG_08265 [Microsporum canis CBS 113480]EEQ35446.1 predicted protein [Microsporum canis CBS 113480]